MPAEPEQPEQSKSGSQRLIDRSTLSSTIAMIPIAARPRPGLRLIDAALLTIAVVVVSLLSAR